MPFLRVETNVPKEKVPKDFAVKGAALLARILGKPKELCYVSVTPGIVASFGGVDWPAGLAVLTSIGGLGVPENKKHSKELHAFFEKELGIPNNKLFILYQEARTANVGFEGTTFHEILGE